MKIDEWDILEDIIEEQELYKRKQEKGKEGRPKRKNIKKKKHYVQINQQSIEKFLKKEKQEVDNSNKDNDMDIEQNKEKNKMDIIKNL